jgi:pimeloyl-ACP methyl ester carboxylesterase
MSDDNSRYVAAARSLDIPTLLVRGHMSDVLSQDAAMEFLSLVPHAKFTDVQSAGHMIAGDRNDVFSDAILNFLKNIR